MSRGVLPALFVDQLHDADNRNGLNHTATDAIFRRNPYVLRFHTTAFSADLHDVVGAEWWVQVRKLDGLASPPLVSRATPLATGAKAGRPCARAAPAGSPW